VGTETSTLHNNAALPDVLVFILSLVRQELQESAFCFFRNIVHRAGGPIRELSYTKEREIPHAAERAVKLIFFLVLTYVREC
jgi:hypothetical protein